MTSAGVDTTIFKPHSTRAAATSKAKTASVPIQEILKTAGWSSSRCFEVQKTDDPPPLCSGPPQSPQYFLTCPLDCMTWAYVEYGRHVARRRRLRSMPLDMLTMKMSCMVSISMHTRGPVPIVMMLRLTTLQAAGAPHVQSECTRINTYSLIVNEKVAPKIIFRPER